MFVDGLLNGPVDYTVVIAERAECSMDVMHNAIHVVGMTVANGVIQKIPAEQRPEWCEQPLKGTIVVGCDPQWQSTCTMPAKQQAVCGAYPFGNILSLL